MTALLTSPTRRRAARPARSRGVRRRRFRADVYAACVFIATVAAGCVVIGAHDALLGVRLLTRIEGIAFLVIGGTGLVGVRGIVRRRPWGAPVASIGAALIFIACLSLLASEYSLRGGLAVPELIWVGVGLAALASLRVVWPGGKRFRGWLARKGLLGAVAIATGVALPLVAQGWYSLIYQPASRTPGVAVTESLTPLGMRHGLRAVTVKTMIENPSDTGIRVLGSSLYVWSFGVTPRPAASALPLSELVRNGVGEGMVVYPHEKTNFVFLGSPVGTGRRIPAHTTFVGYVVAYVPRATDEVRSSVYIRYARDDLRLRPHGPAVNGPPTGPARDRVEWTILPSGWIDRLVALHRRAVRTLTLRKNEHGVVVPQLRVDVSPEGIQTGTAEHNDDVALW